jgi:hypothetical protein
MTEQPGASRHEEYRLDGSDLMDKAKQLVDEGNKRRFVVRNEEGRNVFDVPLTLAVVGGILVLPATAVGVIAALATRHSLVVESVADAAGPTNGTSDETEVPPVEPTDGPPVQGI